jgi:hypothetical protein
MIHVPQVYRHVIPLVACGCLLAPMLSGADGVVLGLAIESLPTDYDFTIRDGGTVTTGSDSFDQGFGATAGIRLDAPLGVHTTTSFALDLALGSYSNSSGDRFLTSIGRVVLGYSYRLDSASSIGAEGWCGAGFGWLDIAGVAGAPDAQVDGPILEFGARLVTDYGLGGGWYVRGGIGWQGDQSRLNGDGLDVDLTQSGPVALIGIGWSH